MNENEDADHAMHIMKQVYRERLVRYMEPFYIYDRNGYLAIVVRILPN